MLPTVYFMLVIFFLFLYLSFKLFFTDLWQILTVKSTAVFFLVSYINIYAIIAKAILGRINISENQFTRPQEYY